MSRFSACFLCLRPVKWGLSSGLRLCYHNLGLPKWHGGRESASQSRRHRDASPIPESGRSLEEELVTCLSILPWEIPWTDPGAVHGPATAHGVTESDTTEHITVLKSLAFEQRACISLLHKAQKMI